MGGKSTLKTRMNALDGVFSEWVRRKDATPHGIARCVTCGHCAHWKNQNAGHFWKRQHKATRWNPFNVAVQCIRCNKFRGGAEAEHAAYIIREYGLKAFEDLEEAHNRVKKWTKEEVQAMILYYGGKLKELDQSLSSISSASSLSNLGANITHPSQPPRARGSQ